MLPTHAKRKQPYPKDNESLVRAIESHIHTSHDELGASKGAIFIETAGGVHSPALHPPHTQSTFLRSLRLPAILIASPHLGGISTTLASYESLLIRGYSVSVVLCLQQPYYRNHEFLAKYFEDRGIRFTTVDAPPEKHGTVQEDSTRLGEWYGRVEEGEGEGGVGGLTEWLEREHEERVKTLDGMAERTMGSVWWPFTQHGLVCPR